MLFGFPLLSLVIWLPIIVGLIVLAIGSDRNPLLARWLSLVGSIFGFIVALPLYMRFDPSLSTMQFIENHVWFERLNVHYHLGIDGISMPLILLNCFITPLIVIAGWEVIRQRVSQYLGAFLIMSGIVNGVFASLDAVLFYTFWEASLIPCSLLLVSGAAPTEYMQRSNSFYIPCLVHC